MPPTRWPRRSVKPEALEKAIQGLRKGRTADSASAEENVVPRPASDSKLRSPPISRASRRLIASPRPVPPYFREVELSAWVNGWNSRACCSGGMPMPVSRTANTRSIVPGGRSAAGGGEADLHGHLALLGELERVADQVRQDLPQPQGVADQMIRHVGPTWTTSSTCFSITRARNVSASSSSTARSRNGAGLDIQLVGLDLGEVEDVVDDPRAGRSAEPSTV